MKTLFRSLCLLALLVPFIKAQEEGTVEPTNTTATVDSGLQVDSRTEPERIEFLLNVGAVYMEEKDYASAISAFKRVLEINPESRPARNILVAAYISTDQYEKAVALLEQLIEEYPDDFHLKNNLAWLYATASDPQYRNGDKAVKLAQEAMVLAPHNHHIWSTLSEAYYVSGEYEKAHRAIMHMTRLVTQNGSNVTEELLAQYNEQIFKCKRAWESEQALNGDQEASPSSTNAPAVEL